MDTTQPVAAPAPTPRATGTVAPGGAIVWRRTLPLSVEEAWAAITEPTRTARWFGPWERTGEDGAIAVTMSVEEGSPSMGGRILDCVELHRYTILAQAGDESWELTMTVERGDDATLDADPASDSVAQVVPGEPAATDPRPGTVVALSQVIEDPESLAMIGPGWDYYLDRLVAAETGGDPDAISWDPAYIPGLCDEYRGLLG